MMSPEVQRIAISDYCAARGYEITGWLEGLDQSGSRAKSAWWPRLDAAAEQVKTGEYDIIVVWKFSRTARNRLKWAIALDKVETAGGRIESATEQIDATTSTGRFTRGMLAELNAFEAERIGEVWSSIHEARLAKGLAPSGLAKYGYVWDKVEKIHRVDPVTGPLLAEAYARYVAGESMYMLVRWLNGAGHVTRNGGQWSDRSLRRVLDAGFGAGLIPWHGEKYPGVHEPVIDKDTWQAYLDARAKRRQMPRRVERSQYLLSGMVRCARCEGAMVANNPYDGIRKPSFRCAKAKERGPEICAGGYVAMYIVEDAVKTWLEQISQEVTDAKAATTAAVAAKVSAEGDVRRLRRELKTVSDATDELLQLRAEKLVPHDRFLSTMQTYADREKTLKEQLEMRARDARERDFDPQAVATQLLDVWEEMPVEYKRTMLRTLIKSVHVLTGDRSGVRGIAGGASNAKVSVIPSWS